MQLTSDRKRRSEPLTSEEKKAFVKYVGSFPTKIDAAVALGFTRPTLDGVLYRGSGHPETIKVIREKLEAFQTART